MTGTDSICHDRKNAAGSSNYGALSCILQAFVQGPKSLGLGPNVRETSSKVAQLRGALNSSKAPNKESQHFADFVKHTKEFGSKLMAKMEFVEVTGLVRDSQGFVNPLIASRPPKS